MIIFYFTGTGNSLAVAKRIGGNLISIPQIINLDNQHYKNDVIGVVFPVYALAAPLMVRQFLRKAKFEADYIFAIGTYGGIPGTAMMNIQKLALKSGNRFDYTANILMVDNFLPTFDVKKEIVKIPKKNIDANIAKVIEDIQNRKHNQATGSLAWRFLSPIINGAIKYDKYALRFIVKEECNKCGICTKVCPKANITVSANVHFSNNCSACFACIHLCPQNAIHLKNQKSKKRWRNPEVSLNEIISANNQLDKKS